MTIEAYPQEVKKEKRQKVNAISGGIFLICLGVLLFTGWWWPGIMFALGLSGGAELVFRGKTLRGIGTLVFFCAIPIAIWIIQETKIPWSLVGPLILVGVGIFVLVRAFYIRAEKE